jgi:hypothetical protein
MACLKLKQLPGKLLHTQGLMPKLYAIRLRETTAILPSAPPRGLLASGPFDRLVPRPVVQVLDAQ